MFSLQHHIFIKNTFPQCLFPSITHSSRAGVKRYFVERKFYGVGKLFLSLSLRNPMESGEIWSRASQTTCRPNTMGILSGNRRRVAQKGHGRMFSWPSLASRQKYFKTKGEQRQSVCYYSSVEVEHDRACAGNLNIFSTSAILLLCVMF